MLDWLADNKEWLFSGILLVPITIIGWIIKNNKIVQTQKSGSNSSNIQIGGNITIRGERGKEDDSTSENR